MAVEDFGGVNPETKARRDVKDMGRSLFVYDLAEPDIAKDMKGSYVLVSCGGGLWGGGLWGGGLWGGGFRSGRGGSGHGCAS
jgi:hypothetical protein